MGKGARLKKERKEKELKEIEFREKFVEKVHQDIQHLKTIKSEFVLRSILDKIPEQILTMMADIIIDRHFQTLHEDYDERYAKGERNVVWERHGHILEGSGFTDKQILGWRRRQSFYASLINGVVTIENHEETYTKPGHLLPYLYSIDWVHWGRWEYWMEIMEKGTIDGSEPIPQLTWCHDPYILRTIRASLSDCVNYGQRHGCTLDDFADWILFGFNVAPKHPDIPPEVNLYWLKAFDFGSMIRYPNDYMTWLLIEWYSRNVEEERNVSQEVVDFNKFSEKVAMELDNKNPEEVKKMEMYEEEVGCGTMLLPYSNYTFFAGGGVQDPLAMKLNKIQMLLYAPWYAHNPFRDKALKRWSPMDVKELVVNLMMEDKDDNELQILMVK